MLLIKIAVCALVVLAAAAILFLDRKLKARKLKKQQAFAETIGLTFHDVIPDGMYSRYCGFDLFFNRRNTNVYNVFGAETEDLRILVFEMGYETGKKHSQNHGRIIRQTVVAVEAKNQDFPCTANFTLESGNIQTEQCHDFFAPKLVEYVSQRRNLIVEGFERRLLMYSPRKQVPQTEYRRLVEEGFTVYDLLSKLATTKESASSN